MTKGDRERLRAKLAGRAMQGALSGIMGNEQVMMAVLVAATSNGFENELGFICHRAREYADTLLAELDRTADEPIKAGGTE